MKFSIPDMSCNHCVATIESTLKKIKGIKNIKVDLKLKEVIVEGDVSKEIIISSIENAGYSPKEIS